MLNDLFLRRGRYIEASHPDEVLVSEVFAQANKLDVGDKLGAILNGRWRELTVVGIALSPEYIYEVGQGMLFPDNKRFGVLWMGREALASAFSMAGRIQRCVADAGDKVPRKQRSSPAWISCCCAMAGSAPMAVPTSCPTVFSPTSWARSRFLQPIFRRSFWR